MSRNRASAKSAGTRFETLIVGALAEHVDDRIERRRLTGSRDRGDISGIRHMGQRVVVEVKNCARTDLAGWTREADVQRGNDDALLGVVIAKRHGNGDPLEQWVHMTLRDFIALLTGDRPEDTP